MKNFWIFFILLGIFGSEFSFHSYAVMGGGSGMSDDLPGNTNQGDELEHPSIDVLIAKLNEQSRLDKAAKNLVTEIPENFDYLMLKQVLEDGNYIDGFKTLFEHFRVFAQNYTHPNLTTLVRALYVKIYSTPALPDAIRALAFFELEAMGEAKDSQIKLLQDSKYFFDHQKEELDEKSRNLWSSALVFSWNHSISVLSILAEENGYRILGPKELRSTPGSLIHKKILVKYRLKNGVIINLSGEVKRIEVRYNLTADRDGEIEMIDEDGQSLELSIDGIQDIYIQNEQTTNG